ncbi:MAG: hypothetical protein AB1746_10150 [Candidatus Zixiibacteriota bacterium]
MKKYLFFIAVVAVLFTAAIWIGCSDSDSEFSPTSSTEPDVSTYFPLKAGTSTQFIEVNNTTNDTCYHWFTIGSPVVSGSRLVYRWIDENSNRPAFVDTGFLFYDNEAIYYFESPYETPEKLLTAPFQVGSVWLRYNASEIQLDYDNYIDIFADYTNDKDVDDGVLGGYNDGDPTQDDGVIAGKCFPTIGANYFRISAFENITLNNGNDFEGCLKIENNVSGALNYYWYSPGVGLVKYMIGVDSVSYPEGKIAGQIVLSKSSH